MKLSTRCRYGIHAMVDLAQHYGQGPQSLREIAERQEVSEMFLEQIFGALRREGFVESVRGAQGGYLLAKPPGADAPARRPDPDGRLYGRRRRRMQPQRGVPVQGGLGAADPVLQPDG